MQVSPSHIVQELLWLRIRNVLRPTAEWMQGLLYLPPQYLYFGLDPFIFFSPFLTCSRTIFLLVKSPPTHPLLFREEGSLLSTINNRNLHPSLPHSLPPSCLLAYLFHCFFLSLLPFLILPLSSLHFCPPPSPIPNFLSPSSSPFPPSSSPPSLLPPSLPLSHGHVLVEVGCEIGAACRRAWWVAQGDRARRALASNCSPDDKQSKNRQQPL